MRRREVLLLPFASTGWGKIALHDHMPLSFNGLGPLRIGMRAAQIRAVLVGPLQSDEAENEPGCYYLQPRTNDIAFMMRNDRLGRINVYRGRWRTVGGIGIGATETQVRRVHGERLVVEPHYYTGPVGKYLIVRPQEAQHRGLALLYETDGKVVITFRAGTQEAVGLVEGCS